MSSNEAVIPQSNSASTGYLPSVLRSASSVTVSINLTWLKLLAMFAMIFDHASILFMRHAGQAISQGSPLEVALRTPGRLSIPVFAFLVAYGYEKFTKDRMGYAMRLWGFAVLSEPVYVAFFGHYGNAILPLALGATLLLTVDAAKSGGRAMWGWVVFVVFMIEFYTILDNDPAVTLTVGLVLCFHKMIKDGAQSWWLLVPGIVCIVLMNQLRAAYLVMIPVALLLVWLAVRVEVGLPKVRVGRWLGYAFYPGHLAVLVGIGWLLKG